tara:strand:+ start:190 stop:390 length:201 start_codon:yes stop_codon:yes gene_type:complete
MNARDVVMRQTDYDEATATNKLQEHDGDFKAVIREFLGISNLQKKPKNNPKSTQQEIYKQLREFLY